MVGSGKVGKAYYVLQFMGNLPGVGPLFRETSEEVHDAQQKARTHK